MAEHAKQSTPSSSRRHHSSSPRHTSTKSKKVKCPPCGEKFHSSKQLKSHYFNCHHSLLLGTSDNLILINKENPQRRSEAYHRNHSSSFSWRQVAEGVETNGTNSNQSAQQDHLKPVVGLRNCNWWARRIYCPLLGSQTGTALQTAGWQEACLWYNAASIQHQFGFQEEDHTTDRSIAMEETKREQYHRSKKNEL